MTSHRFVFALATLTVACAYYNGLYNANRLANEARRAEAEGRSGDARSLWLQAAVRAESVASKYPDSKYWDDALLMSGRAQSRVGDCALAVPPLSSAIAASEDPSIVSEARVLLAQCQLVARQYDAVVETVTPLLELETNQLVERARVLRGRAELARGNTAAAVADLSPPSDLETRFDLAAALLADGQTVVARNELIVATDFAYQEMRWLGLLDSLGVVDPGGASGFVDRWVADETVPVNARVRLLMGDAARWTRRLEPDIAIDRLEEAARLTGDSSLEVSIRHRLAVLELRRIEDADEVVDRIRPFRDLGVVTTGEVPAHVYADILQRVSDALMVSAGGDLLLFREAEAVRDSLGETALAALLFARLAVDFPRSEIAPKALLALIDLRPRLADSVVAVLLTEYPESPYTDLATGGIGAGFTVLEDSLLRALQSLTRDSVGG